MYRHGYYFKFIPDDKRYELNLMDLIKVSTTPIIPFPEEIVDSIELGDGTTIYRHTGKFKDRVISIECNYVAKDKMECIGIASKIKRYFGSGKGLLTLNSDDRDHYWIVKNVEIEMKGRKLGIASTLIIKFTVDPYRYFIGKTSSKLITTAENVSFINSFEPSYPIFRVWAGSSTQTKISLYVNENKVTITNGFDENTLYFDIDTEQNYMKTVNKDGTVKFTTLKTSGDFDKLQFKPGENKFRYEVDYGELKIEVYPRYKEF